MATGQWINPIKGRNRLTTVPTGLILMACALAAVAALSVNDIGFVSARLVAFHDQVETPPPRSAGLEEIIVPQQRHQARPIVAPEKTNDQPHRLVLRIEFRSSVDLRAISNREATVFLHSYFCSHQEDFAVLSAPTVYFDGKPIRAGDATAKKTTGAKAAQDSIYYFYLNAARRETPTSKPAQMSFDLRVTPENVCFYVTGSGSSGLIYKSSIALIPQDAIAAALH